MNLIVALSPVPRRAGVSSGGFPNRKADSMTRLPSRLAAAALIGTSVAMIFAGSAGASRSPKGGERQAIDNAVLATRVAGLNQVPRSHYRITGERVSTVSSSWAKAEIVARAGFKNSFQNAIVVEVRPAGTRQWVVVDLGSAQVGCGIAPDKVLADLFKVKTPCPPGTGIG
jgi:hypothetical protein